MDEQPLYFEEHGQGQPLILLHGNGEDHHIFDAVIPLFAKDFRVIAVDSRGHGQSPKSPSLHYADMAEDVADLIQALALERPALFGFSDGGILGLLLAIHHPGLLSKLAVSGANTQASGIKTGILMFLRLLHFFTRSAKTGLMVHEPNIAPDELAAIDIPVLVLAGSRDIIRQEHTEALAAAIPAATLQILEGETHSSYIVQSQKLYALLYPFLAQGGVLPSPGQ